MIIWISSYPKSGNTWVRSFLSAYYYSKDGNFNFELLSNIKQFPSKDFSRRKVLSVDDASKNWLVSQKEIVSKKKIFFLKTHNIYGAYKGNKFTTPEFSIGQIYIVRDPRNVISSLMNHYSIGENEALDMICSPYRNLKDKNDVEDYSSYSFISSWANNYKSWKNSDIKNKLLIKYEDLETDTEQSFIKIIKFTNNLINNSNDMDSNKIKKSIENTNFETLKKKEKIEGFAEAILDEQGNKKTFFNLGKNNNYKKLLNISTTNKLEKIFNKEMKELNYI